MNRDIVRKERLDYVDMAKFIALLCIICGHTDGGVALTFIENMRLPVFWFCAGYTTSAVFSLPRKFKGLLKPYIAMSLIYLLFTLAYNPAMVTGDSLLGIAYSRFNLYAAWSGHSLKLMTLYNGVLWFLTAFFSSYCVFRLVLMPRRLRGQGLLALLSLVVFYFLNKLPVLLPWSLDTAFFFAPVMWAGRATRLLRLPERFSWQTILVSAAVYVVFNHVMGIANYSIRDMGVNYPAVFVAAVSGPMAFLCICRYAAGTKVAALSARLNRKALYIFGLQTIFLVLMERICGHFGVPLLPKVLIQVFVATAAGYLTGIVCDALLSRFKKR